MAATMRDLMRIVETSDWNIDAYHGTNADFTEFKNKKFGQLGFHFGSTPQQANKRIARIKNGALVMPVKLRLNNPIKAHDMADWKPENVIWGIRHAFDKYKITMPDGLRDLFKHLSKRFHEMDFDARAAAIQEVGQVFHKHGWPFRDSPPEAVRAQDRIHAKHAKALIDAQAEMLIAGLKSLGYDGITYDNRFEGAGDSYLVFDPQQVRSRFAKFDPAKAHSSIITDSRHHRSQ